MPGGLAGIQREERYCYEALSLTQQWKPFGQTDRDQRSAGEEPAWEELVVGAGERRSSEVPAAGVEEQGPGEQEPR